MFRVSYFGTTHSKLTRCNQPHSDVIRQREVTFSYGSEKVRGVNLGGWFVLERMFPFLNSAFTSGMTLC
jgi:hypothetical protein